jgi:hypothetical protein
LPPRFARDTGVGAHVGIFLPANPRAQRCSRQMACLRWTLRRRKGRQTSTTITNGSDCLAARLARR